MSLTRWLALGSFPIVVIAAILVSLTASSDAGHASALATPVTATGPLEGAVGSIESTPTTAGSPEATPASELTGSSDEPDHSPDRVAPDVIATETPENEGSTASVVPPAPTAHANAGAEVRLRIPALQVDAAVTPLGFDGAGGYAVPTTAAGVGWYEFSAYPGAAGNAVLGGHLNWRGDRGVFDRLDELAAGDLIYVDTAAGQVTYQVVGSHSVTAQTPFIDILGERTGPSTLTLFTCGGTYSSVAGEYDERLVVNAVRI